MTGAQGWGKSIIAIMIMAMFLVYPWCSIDSMNTDEITNSEYAVDKQHSSWESEWIASEPSVLSSEFGGGISMTMKWLAGQYQIHDCDDFTCPPIDPIANEWMQRETLPILLVFNRPGPSVETQNELFKHGITLNINPWRDDIDTPLIDESKLVGSFDEEFVEDYTRRIVDAEDDSFDLKNLDYSPPIDWSLGAWGSWVQASIGSDTATLHAPLRENQDFWRIGDVWFASAKIEDVAHLVSNDLWTEISEEIPSLVQIDLDLNIGIHVPLNEDRKWTGTDIELDVGTPPAWNHSVYNTPLRGDNIRVADFDTGIDVFHPAFFNPSNNLTTWVDDNSNAVFDWGIDGIDYDGDGQLSANESLVKIWSDGVDSINRLTFYLDLDENGIHDHGSSSVYDDSSPGFGEPMYQAKDQNSDGFLSTNEYFMRLEQSTILATYDPNSGECVRGTNLTNTAPDTNGHGTSVQGIIAANNESHHFSGLAPNADLLSFDAFAGGFANAQSWGTQRNADVMLYEVGGWISTPMDGTTPVELSIDQLANAGIVQINPAGNLGGKNKVMQGLLPDVDDSIGPLTTKFEVQSNNRPDSTWISYVIPNGNSIGFVEITKPGGSPVDVSSSSGYVNLGNDDWVWLGVDNSARNTNNLNLAFSNSNGLTVGVWDIDIAGPTSQGRVLFRGYEADSVSSWSGGSTWREPSPSSLASIGDNGTVTWPATADNAITIASWATRARYSYVLPGELSLFSSRGTRINDGMPLVDIATPGNYDVWSTSSSQSGADFGSYHYFSGTSAAGPAAAAIAALMLQDNPGIGHHGIWNIINATAHWNSTTGDLWNYSSRLSGDVGNPTDVVGATLLSNGTWGLSQPYGTPLGNGIRVGDPEPGTPAPNVEWGWGYIRADRATERDTISPEIYLQTNVVYESLEPTNITVNVNDNSIGDGNPITMNVTCLENQNGTYVVVDFQENLPIGPINCTFESIGWNSVSLEVKDYSNNKEYSTINVSTIFGEPTQLVSSSPTTHIVTTDELIQLEGRVSNAWGAERPLEGQEWLNGLGFLNWTFAVQSMTTGYVVLDPIQTGLHNLSINLYNSSLWFNIDVSRGANHHADFRAIPPSSGATNEQGVSIYTPDEPIRFEILWYDQDNNEATWENYTGNDVGYIMTNDNFTEDYISAQDAEANDTSIGHWNNSEFNPLRSGEINLWIGMESLLAGNLVKGNLSVHIEPGIAQELYLMDLENYSIELTAGSSWTAELYGHDIANNTVEILTYDWELYQSTNDLQLARLGLSQINSSTNGHTILTQNISGEHLLVASYTRYDGQELTLNLMMNITPEIPDSLIVNPSIIQITAGDYFDINSTLYDQFGNVLDTAMLNVSHTEGLCNCSTSSGDWHSTKSGIEYIYLQYGEINQSVQIIIAPTFISVIDVGIGGNESLEIGQSRTLNFIAIDEYNNSVDLDYSLLTFTEVEQGLTLNNLEVTAVIGGTHTIRGGFSNQMGQNIEFEMAINVWGDIDGDGVANSDDAFPNDVNETLDSDGDGVGDEGDAFPDDSTEDTDSDNDGTGDNAQLISYRISLIIFAIVSVSLLLMAYFERK